MYFCFHNKCRALKLLCYCCCWLVGASTKYSRLTFVWVFLFLFFFWVHQERTVAESSLKWKWNWIQKKKCNQTSGDIKPNIIFKAYYKEGLLFIYKNLCKTKYGKTISLWFLQFLFKLKKYFCFQKKKKKKLK